MLCFIKQDVSDVTTFEYDASNRLIKTTNALGHSTETLSFDASDRPLEMQDANGVITKMVYDVQGRVTSSTQGYGTASAAITSYTYDDHGNVLTLTAANGVVVTYGYDDARRLTSITDGLGNSMNYTLDDAGNITQEDYYDIFSTLKYTHSNIFDELSRVISSVDSNSDNTDFTYDLNGNATNVIDGNYNATSYAFDGLDRLVNETDALYGVTSYDLNELDQNEGTTDPRSNTTSYSHNAFGDVVSETSPDRGTTNYSYDMTGNMLSRTDARGEVVTYSYDALNRITSTSYASDSNLDEIFTYDSASVCGSSIGRLCSVSDASGISAYIYDALGRLMSVTETRDSLSFTTSYGYDASGTLTSITLPSGRLIAYVLNVNGQVSSVTEGANTLASGITYLPFGGVESLSFGNSLALSNTYNTAYQLTNKQHGSLFSNAYTYDANNQRTEKNTSAGTTHYVYGMGGLLYGEYDDEGNMQREYIYLNGEPLAQIDQSSTIVDNDDKGDYSSSR